MLSKRTKIALLVAVGLTAGYSFFSESEPEEPTAPAGYSYSLSGHLVPDINIKMLKKGVNALNHAMHNDSTGALASYAVGYNYLISTVNVKSPVLNKRPYIQYLSSDKESIKLQPRGIAIGIQYNGESNFNRQVFDEVAFGFLTKWIGSSSTDRISTSVFGKLVHNDVSFPLAILYFQRQFLEQTVLKGFSKVSGYKPLFADYSYLYGEHIAKKIPFKEDTLNDINSTVQSNIVATKYLAQEKSKNNPKADEMALFLIEFYINEDLKLLKSLERDLRMITPPDNKIKELKRMKRFEDEMRRKQRIENDREKAQRKSRRVMN